MSEKKVEIDRISFKNWSDSHSDGYQLSGKKEGERLNVVSMEDFEITSIEVWIIFNSSFTLDEIMNNYECQIVVTGEEEIINNTREYPSKTYWEDNVWHVMFRPLTDFFDLELGIEYEINAYLRGTP